MKEHITSVAKKGEENKKATTSPERNTVKDPFGEVMKPSKTIDWISPNGEGGMSLKTIEECEGEEAKREFKKSLDVEGVEDEDAFPGIFLPNEVEAPTSKEGTGSPKSTGTSEFVKGAYEAVGVVQPSKVGGSELSKFAKDAYKHANAKDCSKEDPQNAPGEVWQTQKTHRKTKPRPGGGVCGDFSLIALCQKMTGGQQSPSGSASDSTTHSPKRNSFSPLLEEKEDKDDDETTAVLPIDEIESALEANNQAISRAPSRNRCCHLRSPKD